MGVRLSLLDKNIDTYARLYAYITEKSHIKMPLGQSSTQHSHIGYFTAICKSVTS